MKATGLVFSLGSALLLFACGRAAPGGGGVDRRLADLEEQVGTLKERNRDLRAKLRLSHSFPTRSPLEDFFNSPEFWQCTYDSSWSDCADRCSEQTSEGFQACLDNHPEGPARVQCIEDNTNRGQNCLKACPVQTSPTDPPECRGGGPA